MIEDILEAYRPEPLGSNALRRLGKRIGSRETLSDEEVATYRNLISDAERRMAAARTLAEEILGTVIDALELEARDFEVTGRVKTLSTLADKLERSPTIPLQKIHDVAGARAVFRDISTLEQRLLAQGLAGALDQLGLTSKPTRTVNRLQAPSYGYRALHLIVWLHGRPVEVQLRTGLQHAWAQSMEIICDRWGREPRYGLPVRGRTPEERETRADVIAAMGTVSELIDAVELRASGVSLPRLMASEFTGPIISEFLSDEQRAVVAGVDQSVIDMASRLEDVRGQIRQILSTLHSQEGG